LGDFVHALLVSTGSAGNMLPFIGLGEALRARGHDVTFIASGAGIETARRASLDVVDLDDPQARPALPVPDAATVRKPGFLRTLGPHAVRHMRRVYQLVADRQTGGETVLVAQGWLFGARIAQEKLGLPLATVYLQPLLFGSIYDTPGLPFWVPRWIPRLVNTLVERSVDWGLATEIDAFRAELGLQPVRRPVLRWWRSPELVIGFFPARGTRRLSQTGRRRHSSAGSRCTTLLRRPFLRSWRITWRKANLPWCSAKHG
jgi:rhamnosyltransferase subunit B